MYEQGVLSCNHDFTDNIGEVTTAIAKDLMFVVNGSRWCCITRGDGCDPAITIDFR